MHDNIFARIDGGVIVQYPLNIDDINQRNIPTDVYLPCYFSEDHASIAARLKLSEKILYYPKIVGTVVYVDCCTVKKTIVEMFDYLHQVALRLDAENNPYIDRILVTSQIYSAFEEVIKEHVSAELNTFARTRGYDDLRSVCTYYNSSNPTYQTEATRAIYLRDETWSTLYQYFQDVQTGTAEIPVYWSEIQVMLPQLTW